MISTESRAHNYPSLFANILASLAQKQNFHMGQSGPKNGWYRLSYLQFAGIISISAEHAAESHRVFVSLQSTDAAAMIQAEMAGECASPPAEGDQAAVALTPSLVPQGLEQIVDQLLQRVRSWADTALAEPVENKTEALAAVAQRRGQDNYRNRQLELWGGACAVTRIRDLVLIRASHAKPWSTKGITDAERLDPYNGLSLSALWDAAFDSGLVTFGDDGHAIYSVELSMEARNALETSAQLPIAFDPKHLPYMRHHRQIVFNK